MFVSKGKKKGDQSMNQEQEKSNGKGSVRPWILLRTRDEIRKLAVGDILYLEQELRKVRIKTAAENLLVTGRVRELQEQIRGGFWMCHSYLAINLDRVLKVQSGAVVFENGEQYLLSRDAAVRAKKALEAYLVRNG